MLRYRLTRLSRPDARRAFGRTWLGVCLVGAFATLVALGPGHLFVVLTLWLVCIFAPVRIGVELLHTLGPRVRDTLRRDLERRPPAERYATRPGATLMTELLFERAVRLPRLAPPDLAGKVTDAAVGITVRAFGRGDGPGGVSRAASACYALLDQWMGAIRTDDEPDGGAPSGLWNPGASIQEQWVILRAVAALAALTKTLVAVYNDSAGRPMEGGSAIESAADSAMDYADQVGLQLDGPPWEPAPGILAPILRRDALERLAEAWTAFCAAPQPAPRRLRAFLSNVPP